MNGTRGIVPHAPTPHNTKYTTLIHIFYAKYRHAATTGTGLQGLSATVPGCWGRPATKPTMVILFLFKETVGSAVVRPQAPFPSNNRHLNLSFHPRGGHPLPRPPAQPPTTLRTTLSLTCLLVAS